jgi:hypothetical protein
MAQSSVRYRLIDWMDIASEISDETRLTNDFLLAGWRVIRE